MANFTEEKINAVWQKAKIVTGVNSNIWRKDACDAWINKDQYGQETDYGWEIDHILPIAKDGTDHTTNLRAMHWQNNRSKGDNFPDYKSAIKSDANKNIELEEEKTVNKDTVKALKNLYPNNKNLK